MRNFTLNFYCAKTRFYQVLGIFAMLLMTGQMTWGQTSKQVIGSFPSMDGGFEGTIPFETSVTTPATNTARAGWGAGTATIADNTSRVRTGNHSLNFTTPNSTSNTYSPTASNGAITSNTTGYVVQYYAWKQDLNNARTINAAISPDNTFGTNVGVVVGSNSTASSSWQKVVVVVTSATQTPRYGSVRIAGSGGSGVNLAIDDFVLYTGGAEDLTIPVAATSASATVASSTSLTINWTGAQYAGDGGGYVIVRYSTNAAQTLNQNGIYAVNNTSASGGGTIVGITPGIAGTSQSFTDTGLTAGTTYYYSIFAADKAFNYAAATTCSGTPTAGLTPPTLVAATATVDAPFDVTFTDDAAWRSAITSITVGGTTLTAGWNATAAGKITFTPSASVPAGLLQTSGTKNIVITAAGYSNATVSQTIAAGAAAKLAIATQPAAPAANGAVLAAQPVVTIQDQYGNTSTSTAVVVAAVGAGTWTLGGTASVAGAAGTVTYSGLTASSTAAVTGATITFTSAGLTSVTSNGFNIPGPAAPTLTAASGAGVDAPFDVTFTDDVAWRSAITSITVGGTTLTAGWDATAAGIIRFTPSASVPAGLLQTSGTKNIVVIAAGYLNAAVSQTIAAGAVSSLAINTQPTAPATNGGALAVQPVAALKDQYGNTTNSTQAVTVVANAGTWNLDGTLTVNAVNGIATFNGLTAGTTGGSLLNGAYLVVSSAGAANLNSNTFNIPSDDLAADYFRSAATADWNVAGTWEISHNGTSGWRASTLVPGASASAITILGTHIVTISTSITADDITVAANGRLNVANGGTLTVANGAAATDLIIDGYLKNSGTLTLTGAAVVNNGGVFEDATTSLTLPGFTYASGSTLKLTGTYTGVGTQNLSANSYQNIIWNGTIAAGADYVSFGNNAVTIAGKLTASGTGSGALLTSAGTTTTLTVGSYEQTSGNVFINRNAGGTRGLTINGAATITGGSLYVKTSGAGSAGQLTFKGSVTVASGANINNDGTAGSAAVIFAGTATQTFSNAGNFNYSGSGSSLSITVNAGAIVDFGSSNFGTSTNAIAFTSQSGSTLITSHANGINGNLNMTGTKTLNAATSYEFNGTIAQVTGALLTSANNLTINNPAGVSLSTAATVSGNLTLTSGNLTLGGNNLTLSATVAGTPSAVNHIVTDGSGTLKATCAAGNGYTFPIGYSAGTYNPVTITNNSTGSLTYSVLAKATAPALAGSLSVMWDITGAAANSTFDFPWGTESVTGTPAVYQYDGSSAWNIKSGATTATSITTLTGATSNSAGAYWTVAPANSTTWNGSGWSYGVPTSTVEAIITGAFDTSSSTGLEFTAKKLTINSGGSLTIKGGTTVTIQNELINNAGTSGVTVEDTGSLVQVNDAAPANSGIINYIRKTTDVTWSDYTYWSSPVAGQTLNISPAYTSGLYYSFNDTTQAWKAESASTVMTACKGYIIRGPKNNNPPSQFTATFTGVPNNGPKSIAVSGPSAVLIGNPYPSALNADKFLTDNSSVLKGTIYFWTHKTAIQLASNITNGTAGSGTYAYTSDDYASYNVTGGVGVGTDAPNKPGFTPNGKIAAGQSFFATSLGSGTVVYNNSMRLTNNNSQFFKTKNQKSAVTEKNRVWLDLTNTQGLYKQTLIGYVTGATNNFDNSFDGETLNGNKYVDFYSINQNKNLVIQGRSLPFDKNDEVPLGYKTTVSGDLSISISNTDGILTDQDIMLEDKTANTTVNLKNGSYTFNSAAGTFNNRFVLRYINSKTLSTADVTKEENKVLVTVADKQIKINSSAGLIDKVVVFDLSGKQIYQKTNIGSSEYSTAEFASAHQALIVKTTLQNGSISTEKIVY